ncbi:uncharacterized protein OCT59_025295 [Rhizophagus irregularis]|uniref:Crinkler family protein n=2 Tax=Rhizophagus irregularis TaxID=588596 RepID=U9SK94_RHIID|nr:hypothetical protein GLOIN_2v583658 [Rhizophagus irregularis DAOM 181602=DAOM 197198]POG62894.1 hypothetical protein GLOIN_2v583658 [Rhizophagus irregularis DAOM 181602=DAOM 197198]UZO04933.1 hypothetical protein OCT59_025295 [Rhizophagus irregularis]|eukprot:XP_025169760.1 hypothetical protein GLOIN_2v583658 [Rhizophagus irregularis DAOM 181602=DAOM 197198]
MNKLELSLNCLILGQTLSKCFCVDIGEINLIDNGFEVTFADFKVSHLIDKIFLRKNLIQDKNEMDIHKVDSKKVNDEKNNLKGFTKDDIKNKLNGELLTPMLKLTSCFNTEEMDQEGINIFIVLTPTAGPSRGVAQGPNWRNTSSIYEWIQEFTLNRGNSRLVNTYGKNFELYQREDTIETLWKLIKERYPYRNDDDKGNHPIPVLAGGPGTGKSRFLDEIERLLWRCINESDEEIRNGFANMVVINTTYGNGSPASSHDSRIIGSESTEIINGQASFALRILFEYFQPQNETGELSFPQFNTLCSKKAVDFTLDTALRVIYADFISKQRKQETSSCPPLVLVIGIDEFNNLHDIQKGACKELIKTIGGVMCKPPANIFFIPILAGTIEGAISDYISGSMHEPILLPLRLLNNDDAISIGKRMNLFDDDYVCRNPYFRISISDVGGHVRTLEYYYSNFAKQKDDKMKLATETETGETGLYDVNIGKVMEYVKHKIVNKYQINRYSSHLSVPLAKAILGFPVGKVDAVKKENVKDEGKHQTHQTYEELVSMGLINLVPAGEKYLIRLPYLWVCAIAECSSDPDLSNWKSMLQYDDPINWQNFEDFNAKFLALRLALFRLLGYEEIILKEFLKGADFSHSFPDVKVVLPETRNIKLYKLLHRYPVAKTYKNQEAKYENLKEKRNGYFDLDLLQNDDIKKYTGCVFLNVSGAPWDVFGLLKCGSSESEICCVAQQLKLTTTTNVVIDQKLFKNEHKKVIKNMEEVDTKNWVLLFLTNADQKDNLSVSDSPNSALVSIEKMQEFYGYTYASRAQFASANDKIYFNSAPVESLKLIGFSDKDNVYIRIERKKRPFTSLNDIKERLDIEEDKFKKLKFDRVEFN